MKTGIGLLTVVLLALALSLYVLIYAINDVSFVNAKMQKLQKLNRESLR